MPAPCSYVLLIDDSICFAECMAEILNSRGYRVALSEDVETGLELVGKEKPDLLIVDSKLPGMRGEFAVSEVRRQCSVLPIIGMSAEDRAGSMREAGATEYLQKPFEMGELLEMIELLLR